MSRSAFGELRSRVGKDVLSRIAYYAYQSDLFIPIMEGIIERGNIDSKIGTWRIIINGVKRNKHYEDTFGASNIKMLSILSDVYAEKIILYQGNKFNALLKANDYYLKKTGINIIDQILSDNEGYYEGLTEKEIIDDLLNGNINSAFYFVEVEPPLYL